MPGVFRNQPPFRIVSEHIQGAGVNHAPHTVFQTGFRHVDRAVDIDAALQSEPFFPEGRVAGHMNHDIAAGHQIVHFFGIRDVGQTDFHRKRFQVFRDRSMVSGSPDVAAVRDQFPNHVRSQKPGGSRDQILHDRSAPGRPSCFFTRASTFRYVSTST